MAHWLDRRNIRGGISLLANAVSLGATFYTSNRPIWAASVVFIAVVVSILLFSPELKSLRITIPKTKQAESPGWLYVFGISSIFMVGFAIFGLYQSYAVRPTLLTEKEFSEGLISHKYVKIADLADSLNTIEGRSFEDSYLYGPAVLSMAEGTDIGYSEFLGAGPQTLMPVTPGQQVGLGTGIIIIKDSKFRRCHFVNITIVGSPIDIQRWQSANNFGK